MQREYKDGQNYLLGLFFSYHMEGRIMAIEGKKEGMKATIVISHIYYIREEVHDIIYVWDSLNHVNAF